MIRKKESRQTRFGEHIHQVLVTDTSRSSCSFPYLSPVRREGFGYAVRMPLLVALLLSPSNQRLACFSASSRTHNMYQRLARFL